jgi:hypothetical protein
MKNYFLVVIFFFVANCVKAQFNGVRTYKSLNKHLDIAGILPSSDSGIVMVCKSQYLSSQNYAAVIKLNSDGTILWQTHGLANNAGWEYGVDLNTGKIITGATQINTVLIAGYDNNGNQSWIKRLL